MVASLPLQVSCERRGFMPKGGGVVRVAVDALKPGEALRGFALTERGEVRDQLGRGRQAHALIWI
jgi:RNA 3'-terminal phosphate cyclase